MLKIPVIGPREYSRSATIHTRVNKGLPLFLNRLCFDPDGSFPIFVLALAIVWFWTGSPFFDLLSILIDQKGFHAGVEPKKEIAIEFTRQYLRTRWMCVSRDLLHHVRFHIIDLFDPLRLKKYIKNTDQDPLLMLTRRFFSKSPEIDRLPILS